MNESFLNKNMMVHKVEKAHLVFFIILMPCAFKYKVVIKFQILEQILKHYYDKIS